MCLEYRECPLVEDNAVVGLNFTWLTAQHVSQAGSRHLSQCECFDSKTSVDFRHSRGKVILLFLFLSAESGLPL